MPRPPHRRGYGIRYTYGIFKQLIRNGAQVEVPDYWLTFGNPFEIERVDVVYPIRFYGHTRKEAGEQPGGSIKRTSIVNTLGDSTRYIPRPHIVCPPVSNLLSLLQAPTAPTARCGRAARW